MRFLFLLLTLTNFVCAQIAFVNPEPGVADQTDRHYELNPTYVIGSSLLIQWTSPPSTKVSMVLYQDREADQFEYVFANSVGLTSFRWNVGTQKDLKDTNVFFFQIFVSGETAPSAGSRFFNLTRGSGDDDDKKSSSRTSSSFTTSSTLSATPTLSLSSDISTSTSATGMGMGTGMGTVTVTGMGMGTVTVMGTGTGTGTGTASSSAEPTALLSGPNSEVAKNAISAGTKIGLGVGIPVGVIVLAALAFFLWRRRKSSKVPKDDYMTTVPPNMENKYTPSGDGSYAPNAMAEQGGGYYKPAGTPGVATELSGGVVTPGTMRSELANTGMTANGAGPNDMYSPPVGASVPHGHGGGEVHEMSSGRH